MQSQSGIRKNRKALLANLSSFVQTTKEYENAVKTTPQGEVVEYDVNEMIMKAFKVVTRAVRFVDIWEDHLQSIDACAGQMHVPPTPPADHTEFGNVEELDNLASPTTSHNPSAFSEHTDARRESTEQITSRPRYSRTSQTFIRPGSSNSCRSCRPPSKQGPRNHTLQPASCKIHPGSQNLVSEKLTLLHNSFLTFLGYFIGLHLQSRSSSELLLTTKESVLACKDMLELITAIWDYDHKRSHVLGDARDNMYRRIGELAEAAQSIFRPLHLGNDDEIVLPSEGRPLMEAATACVRAAGEAVSESRMVIERIGDFAFEPLGLGISDIGDDYSAGLTDVPSSSIEVDQSSTSPLQPTNRPPSPPRPSSQHLPIASAMLAPEDCRDDLVAPSRESANDLLPPLPAFVDGHLSISPEEFGSSSQHSAETSSLQSGRLRTGSFTVSSTAESSTYIGSVRDSETSAASQSSTRATSPDATFTSIAPNIPSTTEYANCQQPPILDSESLENCIMERTFAHELMYNREGQITGGTLPALIERLTTPDTTPDASFVSTFFLTFRLFATPTDFAQALIDRFQYVADSPRIAGPVRLRVYNVFKGWLESHWRSDCDKPALELIVPFAKRQLQIVLPTAGKQLARLTEQVADATAPLVPRLVSSIGKTNTSIGQYVAPETPIAPAILSKSQMGALKSWKQGGRDISIMDFDPLELARQFTLKESQIFCSILPEELLASEWTKKTGSMAVNVRAMSRLSTDLANLVTDSILQVEDPKKRATIIKQWIKIANRFFELANYHSLMAIVCSLSQSTIIRLKKTWEVVSTKAKFKLEHLKTVVSHDRNYAALRQRLQNHVPPCVPFVGLYLTDLTFVDAGNQTTRQLPRASPSEESRSVINFDKHVKTAKIISELQRFQIPYRFVEIPELQTWMQDQLVRVRTTDQSDVVRDYYRRSLLLEPREQAQCKSSPDIGSANPEKSSSDKFGVFSTLGWSHHSRDKMAVSPS